MTLLRVIGSVATRRGRPPTRCPTSSEGASPVIVGELWTFLRERKKMWLLPIVLVMMGFGGLLILAQGSVFAPFIYTLF